MVYPFPNENLSGKTWTLNWARLVFRASETSIIVPGLELELFVDSRIENLRDYVKEIR